MNKKIVISIILTALFFSSISSVGISTNKSNNLILSDPPHDYDQEFFIGTMKIINGECSIEYSSDVNDNEVTIDAEDGGNQTSYYKFVINYEYDEGGFWSIDNKAKEKWAFEFKLNQHSHDSEDKYEDFFTFIDGNNGTRDVGSGQLWIEGCGEELWYWNDYEIFLKCKYSYMCNGSWCFGDLEDPNLDITCTNFPAPELEWTALDGTNFGDIKKHNQGEKRFQLTNTGGYLAEDIEIYVEDVDDNGDDYSFFLEPYTDTRIDLDPGESSKEITVIFQPNVVGTDFEGRLIAEQWEYEDDDHKPWWAVESELTLNGNGAKVKSKSCRIFEKIKIDFPFLREFLIRFIL